MQKFDTIEMNLTQSTNIFFQAWFQGVCLSALEVAHTLR